MMFTPIKSTKVYEQVVEQIKTMIIDGTLKKGDKLPSERDLAEQLMVSRTSVREAIRALQVIGLVDSRQGGGNFIRESFENSLFEPLSMMFMLEQSKPEDILQLRRIIEVETASLTAKKINEDQIRELGQLIERLKENNEEDINVILDKEFHYKIARASGNFIVINILNVISTLMDEFIKGARGMILSDESNKGKLTEQHENIYEALKRHDPEGASQAMRRHFELIEEYYYR